MVSDSLKDVVPVDYAHHLDNPFARYTKLIYCCDLNIFEHCCLSIRILFMLGLEHALIGMKVIMSNLIDKVPLYIKKKIAAEKMRGLTAQVEERLRNYK